MLYRTLRGRQWDEAEANGDHPLHECKELVHDEKYIFCVAEVYRDDKVEYVSSNLRERPSHARVKQAHERRAEGLVPLVLFDIVKPDDDPAIFDLIAPVESSTDTSRRLRLRNLGVSEERNSLLTSEAEIENSLNQLSLFLQQINKAEGLHLAIYQLDSVYKQSISTRRDHIGKVG